MNAHSGAGLIRSQIRLRGFELAAVDSNLFGLLDEAELARAAAIDNATTRRDFLAGRVVQRLMAAELLAVAPHDLMIAYACPDCGPNPVPSHGRPGYLLRGRAAADLSISLSRSHGWALVATLPAAGVSLGVDVQHIAQVGFAGFDDVALSPAERSTLARVAPAAREAWRASVWARKEALAKCSGLGLRTEPAHIPAFPEPEFGEGGVSTEVWELVPEDVGLPEGFAAAVAVRNSL